MQFTFTAYKHLLEKLNTNQYQFTNYHDYNKPKDRVVILRHDIDFSLKSAVKFAEIEHDMGISSTYFVLLRTDFYNAASKESQNCIKRIKSLGHEIGLHFDEASMDMGGGIIQHSQGERNII